MNIEIRKYFKRLLVDSLNTSQINHLGIKIDEKFNLCAESGFGEIIPIPRQTAADTLLDYFSEDHEAVKIFNYLLMKEGARFSNSVLRIRGKEEFIRILYKHKWIYDEDLMLFFMDPFFESEINFLKSLKQIDLTRETKANDIIKIIKDALQKLKTEELEWRITLRLYDFAPDSGELVRQIIQLLLKKQKLHEYTFEVYTCLKELSVNASKANYKILFEKHISKKNGVTSKKNYPKFLSLFRKEIETNGNKRLFTLAEKYKKFISITFQSRRDSIMIWVTNNSNITSIEKKQLLKKIKTAESQTTGADLFFTDDKYSEGAGLGISMIMRILGEYTREKHPLRVIFYHDFVKVGFRLIREELLKKQKEKKEGAAD